MRVRLLAASAALAVAAGGGAVAAATAASAATTPTLSVTLSSSADGSNSWQGNDPVLTVGANTSTTYAQMTVNGIKGTLVPGSEPTFDTDHYNAGSPRWVIDLSNGHSLWGYPSESGLNGTDEAWTADNGNTYGSYAQAVSNAGASYITTTVKDAYIVADGDQAAGTSDVLTNVMYDNMTIPQPTGPGVIKGYGGKCLDDYHSSSQNGAVVDLYWCNGSNAQKWTQEPDGTVRSSAAPALCLDDNGYGWKGTKQDLWQCVGQSNEQWGWNTTQDHVVSAYNGLCLNDPGYSTTAGTQQILWTCGNYPNEVYSEP